MAKPQSRTAVLDEVQIEANAEVRIDRHPVDWNSLVEDVAGRIERILKQDTTGCRYFNPAVTVTCLQSSPEFWRIIGKEQGRWCQRAGKTMPRSNRRSPARWTGSGQWISNKYARYLHRALSFTGVLFIDDELVLPHEWAALPGYARKSSSPRQ